ncbi:MAG: porin family protein [Beijerinckiaceae bacterium]
MLRKLLLSSVAATAMISSALAADLPSRKAPPVAYAPPAPIFTWTGFYIGGNLGYGWARADSVTVGTSTVAANLPGFVGGPESSAAMAAAFPPLLSTRPHGFMGGGQVGYNWQFSNFVVGVEADFQGADVRSSTNAGIINVPIAGFPANSVTSTASIDHRLDYLGTLRGRIGYAAFDRFLVYATGGLAYGHVRTNFSAIQTILGPSAGISTVMPGTAVSSANRTGWTIGGGVEYAIDQNWSIKGEYLYYDLGRTTASGIFTSNATAVLPGAVFAQAVSNTSTRWRGSVARAGINYRFAWGAPAPVVARY